MIPLHETSIQETPTSEESGTTAIAMERQETPVSPESAEAMGESNIGATDMATTEERLAILRMIEQNKISAEEGVRLLTALDERQENTGRPANASPDEGSRVLRVRVSELVSGEQKVNVAIPVSLVRLGLRFVPQSSGVDVEVIQDAIERGAIGRVVDVVDHEDGKRVEVVIEQG